MVQVTELGYIGFGVKDLDAWKKFAANILALQVVDEGERDRCYLRMDYWHHRIVLHSDPSDDLMYLGFRVAGAEEFREMQSQLNEAGIAFRVGSEAEAAERRVLEIMKLEDPDGNPVEIFHGPYVQFSRPFHPGRGMHGPLHRAREGPGSRLPLLSRARNARRSRVQDPVRKADRYADLHALQRTRSHRRLRPGRPRQALQPSDDRSGQPR